MRTIAQGARELSRDWEHEPVGPDEERDRPRSSGDLPFSPRAKKCLELALRWAVAMHNNFIGTEHLLLGLAAER